MDRLPDELLLQVVQKVDSYASLATMSCVSKRLHSLAAGNTLLPLMQDITSCILR